MSPFPILGVIDAVVVIDPESGEAKTLEAPEGLIFRMAATGNSEAKTLGRLTVRPGGQVVMVGYKGRGISAADIAAAMDVPKHEAREGTSPLPAGAAEAAAAAAARPAAPARPGQPRRAPRKSEAAASPVETAA